MRKNFVLKNSFKSVPALVCERARYIPSGILAFEDVSERFAEKDGESWSFFKIETTNGSDILAIPTEELFETTSDLCGNDDELRVTLRQFDLIKQDFFEVDSYSLKRSDFEGWTKEEAIEEAIEAIDLNLGGNADGWSIIDDLGRLFFGFPSEEDED